MVHRLMRLRITINGHVYEAEVEVLEEGAPLSAPVSGAVLAPASGALPPPAAASTSPSVPAGAQGPAPRPPVGASGGVEVRATLPGVVSEVRAVAGQVVAAGDVLLVLEAMKMDNDVTAPVAGTVRAVVVASGEQVAAQQVLAVLE